MLNFLLSNIKNSQTNKKKYLLQKKNKLYTIILNLLWGNGYILYYYLIKNQIKINLKYKYIKPVIYYLNINSKFNKNLFFTVNQLYKLNKNCYFIFSTNNGIKSLIECKKCNIGGKLILIVF